MTLLPSLPHRALLVGLTIAGVAGVAGCGDETGLIVEVTRDDGSTPAAIERLEFAIGVGYEQGKFRREDEPITAVDLGASRDLLADPYRLLLEPSGAADEAPPVLVAVFGYVGDEVVGFGRLDRPVRFAGNEVRKWTVVLTGESDYEIGETGCVFFDDVELAARDDLDCDGDLATVDCDDRNDEVGPSSQELCDNQVDDNCNDEVDEEVDQDLDGVSNCADDCDDRNDRVFPGAEEVCDGLDNDCSGSCDELFDADGDELTTCGSKRKNGGALCDPPRQDRVDCDDHDDEVSPLAAEVCDGKDNDCNAQCDEGFDKDGDGFTACGSVVDACDGTDDENIDCEPEDSAVYPGADEICDGKDNDCDGATLGDSVPCYASVGDTDTCVRGERRCQDRDGVGLVGECEPDDSGETVAEAPPELCEAYAKCEEAGDPDPFACANAEVTALGAACMVFYPRADDNELCPEAAERIPAPERPGCRWSVIGGSEQAHYRVGFSEVLGGGERGEEVTAEIDACNVYFVVEEARDAPPTSDQVFLWYRSGLTGDTRVIQVELDPALDPVCPARGLRCPDLLPGMP